MKRLGFLLVLVSVLPLYAQAPERPFDDAPGPRMTRHAAIRVIPSERVRQEQLQRQQILELVHTMLLTRTHISTSDPIIRQQLELEERLAEAVRVHLDDDLSDTGKNGIAMSVQSKLNAMEGQSNCDACHGRASLDVARSR
jgi:hypothetical protein